jgi:hypothetical protein
MKEVGSAKASFVICTEAIIIVAIKILKNKGPW